MNSIKIKLNSTDNMLLDRFVGIIANALNSIGTNSIQAYPIPTLYSGSKLPTHRRILDIHTNNLYSINRLNQLQIPRGIDLYVISN